MNVTITEIKKSAKSNGVEIKKSNCLLNGKKSWSVNGVLMTRAMLVNAYFSGDFNA